eukprot:g10191.t1
MALPIGERHDGSYVDGYESEDSEDEFDDTQYGTMARFVPTLVLERLKAVGEAAAVPKKSLSGGVDKVATAVDKEEGINAPKEHELDAAVMVVDVSGFSGMCERFAQGFVPDGGWRQRMKGIPSLHVSASGGENRGGSGIRRSGASHASVITSLYRLSNDKETKGFGAEGVRDALNLALGALISTVERHGGDVLRIAGDALIVLFHQGGADISRFELAELCLACTRCGWDCASSVGGDIAAGGGGGVGAGLSVHVGVGCGRVSCFHVGSDRLGWQLVVSGELFEDQVAKALDASGAGEVVVSAQVWQYLAGTGWGSGPVQRGDADSPSPTGLRLLHCTPDPWGGSGPGSWDDDIAESGGSAPAADQGDKWREDTLLLAPSHGPTGVLSEAGNGGRSGTRSRGTSASPTPFRGLGVARRSSYSGIGKIGPAAAAAAAAAGPSTLLSHGRAASLDHAAGAVGGAITLGGRWCPSRRRLSLLEEVETGVLTMLSKEVGRALRGYCPQSIREGLVAERLGLLAELQRVAVLFVGLSFEDVGIKAAPARKPGAVIATDATPPSADSSLRLAALTAPVAGNAVEEVSGRGVGANVGDEIGQDIVGEDCTSSVPVGADKEVKVGGPAALSLELLQGSFSLLQSIVASHGGVIKELSVDDKGTVLVVGFGLSPRVGHLPAARATLCAMECTDRLRAKGLARCHAGVATGPVFCGSLGSEDRREFAMISETVNLAQRLMSARKSRRLLPKSQADNTWASEGTAMAATGGTTGVNPITPSKPGSAQKKGAKSAGLRDQDEFAFPLTPVATPTSAQHRKKWPECVGAGRQGGDRWEESFNRWVVLEGETLKEAKKTEQLAFLELEAIKVKGKTSKVDVFSPSLATDVEAALTLPSPLRASRTARLSRVATSGATAVAVGSAGSAPAPRGVIMGGIGGGGGRIPPPPSPPPLAPLPLPSFPQPEGLSAVGVPAPTGVVGSVVRRILGDDGGVSPLLDDSKRYRLESPRKGTWQGGGRRGSGASTDGSLGDSHSHPSGGGEGGGSAAGMDPLPDAAAKRFASWRNPGGPRGVPTPEDGVHIPQGGGEGVDKSLAAGGGGGGGGGVGRRGEIGGDLLSREAFEALLPCIFHADAVHDEVSHILWARTRGRVSYLTDLCRSLVGVARSGRSGGGGTMSFGEVGEDGTWRLRLNEFAHVLKLASRVPPGVEGALQRRLDNLPYNARQVVLRVVCVTVVAGIGETDLLLHLLTNVAPFKEYWKAVVSQDEGGDTPARRRSSRSRRRTSIRPRRSFTSSPVLSPGRPASANTAGSSEDGGAGGTAPQGSSNIGGSLPPERGDGLQPMLASASVASAAEFLREEEAGGGAQQGVSVNTVPAVATRAAAGMGGEARGGSGLSTFPVSPTAAASSGPPGMTSGEEALRSCLAMLEAGGFLRVCEGGKTFICDDVMLIDQVYASTPFKLRKGLHKEAAQWISDRHRRDFRDRADVMPMLISHLTQAHEEARAQAMLAVLKVLGGRFLDRWVLEHVRPLVSIRENPRNPTASEHLALCVLPALPSLRGLSKAIRGAEIAGVVVGVALRLRSLRFKDMDKRAMPRHRRSMSISGSSFKSGGAGGNGSASSPRSRARTTLVKRRSASLAGSTVVPPTSSELGLLPAATTNVDGFEIAVAGATDGIQEFDVTDDSPERDGETGSRPLLVSRRTA